MILGIVTVLLVLWVIGLLVHVGGGLIHILLLAALVVWLVDRLYGTKP